MINNSPATVVTRSNSSESFPTDDKPKRGNVVVSAMLSGNTLRDCQQVKRMFDECNSTHSNEQICRAASFYLSQCLSGTRS